MHQDTYLNFLTDFEHYSFAVNAFIDVINEFNANSYMQRVSGIKSIKTLSNSIFRLIKSNVADLFILLLIIFFAFSANSSTFSSDITLFLLDFF